MDSGISSLENDTHLAPLCQLLLKHSRTPQTVTPHRKSSKTSTGNRGSGEERTDAEPVIASTMVLKAVSRMKSQMIWTAISRVYETVRGWSWGKCISVQRTLLHGALSFRTWLLMIYVRFQMLRIWKE